MSVFDYQGAIKITFDKEIKSNPTIVTGTEYYRVTLPLESAPVCISSGDYNETYSKTKAFDDDLNTQWRANTTTPPVWVGRDFGEEVTLSYVDVAMNVSTGRINAYELQGSHDGVSYDVVTSGNFSNVSDYQVVTFTAATYRYWRLYAISKYSTYLMVSGFRFYGSRNTYSCPGWAVTANAHDRVIGGDAIVKDYAVRKVTKSPDELSVTLWLDINDRLCDAEGLVTVTYTKAQGNLKGAYGIALDDFQLQFTPLGAYYSLSPQSVEHLSAQIKPAVSEFIVTYRYIPAETDTFLVVDKDNPYMDENISAQVSSVTIVMTNVGGLPL